ncbi:OTU domain-containing protein [Cardinium endosymbiont of Tipula unca]|uniref:OTU domain-containing protein n=1 Tax=Cardinium endosymbiont of Tipula unca TaxID=3066216 RepID=UPI0030CCD94A
MRYINYSIFLAALLILINSQCNRNKRVKQSTNQTSNQVKIADQKTQNPSNRIIEELIDNSSSSIGRSNSSNNSDGSSNGLYGESGLTGSSSSNSSNQGADESRILNTIGNNHITFIPNKPEIPHDNGSSSKLVLKDQPNKISNATNHRDIDENLLDQIVDTKGVKIKTYHTTGDGSCFFHAAFGNPQKYKSQGVEQMCYRTNDADTMRKELADLFRNNPMEFEETIQWYVEDISDDIKRFEKTFKHSSKYDINFLKAQNDYTSMDEGKKKRYHENYLRYLETDDYNIRIQDIPYIASLSNSMITIYYPCERVADVFDPTIKKLQKLQKGNDKLWGEQREITIFHKGGDGLHFYKAKIDK